MHAVDDLVPERLCRTWAPNAEVTDTDPNFKRCGDVPDMNQDVMCEMFNPTAHCDRLRDGWSLNLKWNSVAIALACWKWLWIWIVEADLPLHEAVSPGSVDRILIGIENP